MFENRTSTARELRRRDKGYFAGGYVELVSSRGAEWELALAVDLCTCAQRLSKGELDMKNDTRIIRGSGNIFADLDVARPAWSRECNRMDRQSR